MDGDKQTKKGAERKNLTWMHRNTDKERCREEELTRMWTKSEKETIIEQRGIMTEGDKATRRKH